MGLRVVLQLVANMAGKQDKYIEPMLSFYMDYYKNKKSFFQSFLSNESAKEV